MIVCRVCKCEKEPASKTAGNLCKECQREYMRNYNAQHRERILEQKKLTHQTKRQDMAFVMKERVRGISYWQRLRQEVMQAYGGNRCACCGETEPAFLCIDHTGNNGAEHRKAIGRSGASKGNAGYVTYSWLKRNNFPPGYQVLCMNCNHGKFWNGGICPHQQSLSKNVVNSVELQNGQYRAKPGETPEGVTTIPQGSTLKRAEKPRASQGQDIVWSL